MVLSFWLVMFLLLPTVGLGAFAFLMNREQRHHREPFCLGWVCWSG